MGDLITAEQIADMAGCHVETVRRHVRKKERLLKPLRRGADLNYYFDRVKGEQWAREYRSFKALSL